VGALGVATGEGARANGANRRWDRFCLYEG
jgi:hypothetical protein